MMRKMLLALLLCLSACAPQSGGKPLRFQTGYLDLFDTVTAITGYAKSQTEFDRFAETIRGRLEELHRLYDIYHEYNGINNLCTVNKNAGIAPVAVDKDIIGLLLLAREWHGLSGGAVNVALGPVLQIWHEYRTEGKELPPMEDLRKAADLTDINDLVIDEAAGTVFLRKAGMSLDVGSVAKAYAAGLAIQAAEEIGMRSALLDTGGNIVSLGRPPDNTRGHWSIGIQDPDRVAGGERDFVDTVYIAGLSVSSSGGYHRYYVVDGQAYHHIIDPDTMMPATRYKQVAVIHETPALADLLSTALFILPYEEGAALAGQCGAEALWIDIDGSRKATDGFAKYRQW